MTSLEEAIGYGFKNKELLREALTHKSYASERGGGRHNERLEFLGDSVLGLVVSYYLFGAYPDRDEGWLSKAKSALVSRANLAGWAAKAGLGHHLRLGVGEAQTGGSKRQSVLSNSFEALIGAVYLDGGHEAAEAMVRRWLDVSEPEAGERDHKSRLQEMLQKKHRRTPEYDVVSSEGPEHSKTFTVRARLGKKALGLGTGRNKKEAEQAAARNALDYLENHDLKSGEI